MLDNVPIYLQRLLLMTRPRRDICRVHGCRFWHSGQHSVLFVGRSYFLRYVANRKDSITDLSFYQ
jgi:hypothetical protein